MHRPPTFHAFNNGPWSPNKLKSLAATLSLILAAALQLAGPALWRG